jgi:hypothetical protein
VCRAIQPVERFRLGAVRIADGQVRTAISPKRPEAQPASLSLTRVSHRETLRVSPWPSATKVRRVSNSAAVVRLNEI